MKKNAKKTPKTPPRKTLKITEKQAKKINSLLYLAILFLVATVTVTILLITGRGKTKTIALGGGVKLKLVMIQPGSFTMGSDPNLGEGDEIPLHSVTLTHPFYLGQTEVTQEQWRQVMGTNPSAFKGPKLPVDSVSWNDCQLFLTNLGKKTGRNFALPTEAQWEYACRARTTTRWNFGEDGALAGDYAWCGLNSGGRTHPVAQKKPNPWGLYDINGNLWEWCADWYSDPYPAGPVTDPTGPSTGTSRILRGGAWGDQSDGLRSAYRNCIGPNEGHNGTGFRVVMEL